MIIEKKKKITTPLYFYLPSLRSTEYVYMYL